ncbi:MAG: hypothetical protein IKF90_12295 [Parasporobacterium sp.]|nr:hypothetical protein [Parasporobacterium sp.]
MIETTYFVPGVPYLALLGDFHNGDADSVLASLHKHKPDLICIAGDVVYNYSQYRYIRRRNQKKLSGS